MAIKIGDKIRFLNSEGGGIVTRILKNGMVGVEDEYGFEIPSFASECVVVESNTLKPSQGGSPNSSTTTVASFFPKSKTEQPSSPHLERKAPTHHSFITGRLSLSLAFVPRNVQQLNASDLDLYVINESSYHLSLFLLLRQGRENYEIAFHGIVEPGERKPIDTIPLSEINEWALIRLQGVLYTPHAPYAPQQTIDTEIKNDPVRFFKGGTFIETPFFDSKALIVPFLKEGEPIKQQLPSADEIKESLLALKDREIEERKTTVVPQPTKGSPMEVDLHIEQLLDLHSGMSNSEILVVQLDKFHQVMKENVGKKGTKIVFIHGKGEGVLRQAILEQLRKKYGSCFYQDASFREYGFGATLVTVK